MLWQNLMEEIFFFQYHMQINRFDCMRLPIAERRFLIERFSQQKQQEKDDYERERRKTSRR